MQSDLIAKPAMQRSKTFHYLSIFIRNPLKKMQFYAILVGVRQPDNKFWNSRCPETDGLNR